MSGVSGSLGVALLGVKDPLLPAFASLGDFAAFEGNLAANFSFKPTVMMLFGFALLRLPFPLLRTGELEVIEEDAGAWDAVAGTE